MKRVEWTIPAVQDLRAIDDHWCASGAERADEILDTIREAGDFLAGLPNAGPVMEAANVRKWRVRDTNYILLYRLVDDRVQILRVRHGRENWRGS